MPGWTRETLTGIAEADRVYLREWGKVMRAYGAGSLTEIMARYNAAMPAVTQRWNDAIKAAVELSGPHRDIAEGLAAAVATNAALLADHSDDPF